MFLTCQDLNPSPINLLQYTLTKKPGHLISHVGYESQGSDAEHLFIKIIISFITKIFFYKYRSGVVVMEVGRVG